MKARHHNFNIFCPSRDMLSKFFFYDFEEKHHDDLRMLQVLLLLFAFGYCDNICPSRRRVLF